jgi:hypothetical protein
VQLSPTRVVAVLLRVHTELSHVGVHLSEAPAEVQTCTASQLAERWMRSGPSVTLDQSMAGAAHVDISTMRDEPRHVPRLSVRQQLSRCGL